MNVLSNVNVEYHNVCRPLYDGCRTRSRIACMGAVHMVEGVQSTRKL